MVVFNYNMIYVRTEDKVVDKYVCIQVHHIYVQV